MNFFFLLSGIIGADINFKIKLKIGNSQCIYEYFPNFSLGNFFIILVIISTISSHKNIVFSVMDPSNKVLHNFNISKFYKYSFVTDEGGFYGVCYRNNALLDISKFNKPSNKTKLGDRINSTYYTYQFGDKPILKNNITLENNDSNPISSQINVENDMLNNSSYLNTSNHFNNTESNSDSKSDQILGDEESIELLKSSILKISITHGLKAKDYSLITKYKDLLPVDNILISIDEKINEIEKILGESSRYDKVIEFYFQQVLDKIYTYFYLCLSVIIVIGLLEFTYLKNYISRRKYV